LNPFKHKKIFISIVIALFIVAVFWSGTGVLEKKLLTVTEERLAAWSGVNTELASLDLNIFTGRVTLYGLTLQQPDGFGTGRILYAPRIVIDLNRQSLAGDTIRFDEILIDAFELDIRRNSDGQSNLAVISSDIQSRWEENSSVRKSGDQRRTFVIDSLTADNFNVFIRRPRLSRKPIVVALILLRADAHGLRFGPASGDSEDSPGHLEITGEIQQPPLVPARIGMISNVEGIGSDRPAIVSSVRLTGLDLFLLSPVLPSGTGAVLGGDAIDLSVDAAGDKNELTGRIRISTVAGYEHRASLAGTLYKPEIDTDDKAIAWLASRSTGALGNTLRNIWSTGSQAVDSARGVVSGVAEGTVDTVDSFGSGLWKTTKGLVTLDSSKLGKGVREMKASVTGDARDAIFSAGGDVMEGAADITHVATGSEKATRWRQNIPTRWTNSWESAKRYVNE
jgi:hypothetical protein